jgi:peptide/nickel transport system substrate-binding protein
LWSTTDPKLKDSLVTLGGFKLANFTPSQRVEFARTDNFYYVDPSGKKRLPYLDRLVYLVVPDVNTNLFKFKGGETDIAGVRAKDAVGLQAETGKLNCQLYNLGPNTSTQFIMFNMNRRKNDKGKPYVTPYKSVWFNDVNFRQAINHAINRQNVIQGYLRGIGAPAWGCEPVVSPFFDKDLKQVDQDLPAAEKLLAQSGFAKGKDGKLRDKDGHLVELTILYGAGGTFSEAIVNSLETDLRKLGIKLNAQAVNWNVLIDKVDSSKDWEIALYGLSGDPLDPHSGVNVWKTDGRLHLFDEREAGANGTIVVKDARPWEKEIDAIFEEGAQEFDPVKRKAIYNRYQQIVYDQVPFIYLVTPMTIVAARNNLKNYVPNKLSQDALGLHNVEELWKEGAK